MSRSPRVRTWRVAWWRGADRFDVAYVRAPTKTLARLSIAHRPDLLMRNRDADRITCRVCHEVWDPQ
jgi:hypothetical protein